MGLSWFVRRPLVDLNGLRQTPMARSWAPMDFHGRPIGLPWLWYPIRRTRVSHEIAWTSMDLLRASKEFHGSCTGFRGSLVVSRGSPVGFHGCPMDLPWVPRRLYMGLPWALMDNIGSRVGSHGLSWVSHGLPWTSMNLQWASMDLS